MKQKGHLGSDEVMNWLLAHAEDSLEDLQSSVPPTSSGPAQGLIAKLRYIYKSSFML